MTLGIQKFRSLARVEDETKINECTFLYCDNKHLCPLIYIIVTNHPFKSGGDHGVEAEAKNLWG
jgi:hypothetical protein